jgi:hydrogenase large subunit
VEGDLEVRLRIEGGRVAAAYVSSPLYRGFEPMLSGKSPADALVLTPRICGICSVAQGLAAASALRDLTGVEPPPNGRLAECLVSACENLADHLTHFYLFFMPDFARAAYADRPWFAGLSGRFKAVSGSAAADLLPARAAFMHLMGLMAGKWPHTLSLQPGGSARPLGESDCLRAMAILKGFRRFLERTLFGDRLESVAAIESPEGLLRWRQGRPGDLAPFLAAAQDLGLQGIGRGSDLYLSFGAYDDGGGRLFPGGVELGQGAAPLDPQSIEEDPTHAWLLGETRPPARGQTLPHADKPGAYTWCKAPRYGGRVLETGALARQLIAGQPLIRALVAESGGSVLARVLARLLELALVVPRMEDWAARLVPGEPWCAAMGPPESGQGVGLVEAARGALGHWISVERGRIAGYQIVAPTTWNFSPRDAGGVPGPLEQALVGLPAEPEGETPLLVQHVVRSFDPCMVCTVH